MNFNDLFKKNPHLFFNDKVIKYYEDNKDNFQITRVDNVSYRTISGKVKIKNHTFSVVLNINTDTFKPYCSCYNDFCVHQYALFQHFANGSTGDFCIPPSTKDLADYFFKYVLEDYRNISYDEIVKIKRERINDFIENMKYHLEQEDFKYIFKYAFAFINAFKYTFGSVNSDNLRTLNVPYFKFLSTFVLDHLDSLYQELSQNTLKDKADILSILLEEVFYYTPYEKVLNATIVYKDIFNEINKIAESFYQIEYHPYRQALINIYEYDHNQLLTSFDQSINRYRYRFLRKLHLYYALKNDDETYLENIQYEDRKVICDDLEEANLLKQLAFKYKNDKYIEMYLATTSNLLTLEDYDDIFNLNDDEIISSVCRNLYNINNTNVLEKLSSIYPSTSAYIYHLALTDFTLFKQSFNTYDKKYNSDLIYIFYSKILFEASKKELTAANMSLLLNHFEYLIKIPNGVYYAYDALIYINANRYNYYLQSLRNTLMERIGNKL